MKLAANTTAAGPSIMQMTSSTGPIDIAPEFQQLLCVHVDACLLHPTHTVGHYHGLPQARLTAAHSQPLHTARLFSCAGVPSSGTRQQWRNVVSTQSRQPSYSVEVRATSRWGSIASVLDSVWCSAPFGDHAFCEPGGCFAR